MQKQSKFLEEQLGGIEEQTDRLEEDNHVMETKTKENEKQIEEYDSSIQKILHQIQQNEEMFKAGIEEKFKKEEEFKQNQQSYRDILRENTGLTTTIKGLEKQIARHTEELESKVKRLEVLLTQSNSL